MRAPLSGVRKNNVHGSKNNGPSADTAVNLSRITTDLCNMRDLSIAVKPSKTWLWSTDPDIRKLLRSGQYRRQNQVVPVSQQERDVGAHLVYTRARGSGTSTERFAAATNTAHRLPSCLLHILLRLLPLGLGEKALYATEVSRPPLRDMDTLRAAVTSSVWSHERLFRSKVVVLNLLRGVGPPQRSVLPPVARFKEASLHR